MLNSGLANSDSPVGVCGREGWRRGQMDPQQPERRLVNCDSWFPVCSHSESGLWDLYPSILISNVTVKAIAHGDRHCAWIHSGTICHSQKKTTFDCEPHLSCCLFWFGINGLSRRNFLLSVHLFAPWPHKQDGGCLDLRHSSLSCPPLSFLLSFRTA